MEKPKRIGPSENNPPNQSEFMKKCKCFDPKECMQFGCQFPAPVVPQERYKDFEGLQRYIAQLESENKLLREEIERLKKQRNEAQALLNQYAKPGQTFGFSNLDV